jgi:hypothetical protein
VANKPIEISTHKVEKTLELSLPVREALRDIQVELADAYRDGFTEIVKAVQAQASALDRIQNTLNLLIKALAPAVAEQAPPLIRVAGPGESPDLASAVVVADPIGQGFVLSLTNLAKSMGVSAADLGSVVNALKLHEKQDLAVVCRNGRHNRLVNYHPRAADEFKRIIADTQLTELTGNEQSALRRLKEKLGFSPPGSSVLPEASP